MRSMLLLQVVQDLVARQHLGNRAVGLAAFVDRRKELTVLQLDAIHGHRHFGHIDLLFFASVQIVVTRQVGTCVADVAEVGAQGAVVVEAQ